MVQQLADTTFYIFILFFIVTPILLVYRLVNRDTYSASRIEKRALGVDSSESEKAATEEEKDSPDEPIADESFLTITDQTAHKLDQLRISPIDRQPTPTNLYMSTTETHGTQIATALTTNIPVFGQVGLTRYPAADTGMGAAQTSRRSQTAGRTNVLAGSIQGTGSQEITGTWGQTSQAGNQPAGTNAHGSAVRKSTNRRRPTAGPSRRRRQWRRPRLESKPGSAKPTTSTTSRCTSWYQQGDERTHP